jgi:hypothetical protein
MRRTNMPTASPKPGVPRAIDAGFGVMKFSRAVAANKTAINGVVYDSFPSKWARECDTTWCPATSDGT